jgi:hypothetical protein
VAQGPAAAAVSAPTPTAPTPAGEPGPAAPRPPRPEPRRPEPRPRRVDDAGDVDGNVAPSGDNDTPDDAGNR